MNNRFLIRKYVFNIRSAKIGVWVVLLFYYAWIFPLYFIEFNISFAFLTINKHLFKNFKKRFILLKLTMHFDLINLCDGFNNCHTVRIIQTHILIQKFGELNFWWNTCKYYVYIPVIFSKLKYTVVKSVESCLPAKLQRS